MHNCWVTYGSYVEYPSRRKGQWATQIPKHIIDNNSYRHHRWCASHLRSFKHHLWNKIKKEDLLDSSGNFYRMTWDLAFMFPMLEMASALRTALDPAAFAIERLDFTPDSWQAKVLHSTGNLLLNCSRQAGKSTGTTDLDDLGGHKFIYEKPPAN